MQGFAGDTPDLPSWEEVEESAPWTGLLVGNGSSIAIWKDFRYDSLLEVAKTRVEDPLTEEDERLFTTFGTTNFERVLASLKTARLVASALEVDLPRLNDRYVSVQRALFEAIHTIHVPWARVGIRTVPRLHNALRDYTFVYSTNYDLLLYWASMEKGGTGFLDFFWGQPDNSFDPFDTEVWLTRSRWTRIFFLHGGIHLRRLQGGGTRKATSLGGSLLDQFETVFEDEESPLLVSEGDSDDKLLSVSTSDYLTFAHQSFVQHEGGLVVFGHSLGDADEHIVKPIRSWRENPVAVAIRPSNDPEAVIQRKAHVRGRLAPMKNILFFDSSTHPLGSPELVPRVKLFGRGR